MPYDLATRASVLVLRAVSKQTSAEISAILGISQSQVNRIYANAIKRRFNEHSRPLHIEDAYVIDAPRSGRPQKQSATDKDCAGCRDISNKNLADLAKCGILEDEADSEAWTGEKDVGSEIHLV